MARVAVCSMGGTIAPTRGPASTRPRSERGGAHVATLELSGSARAVRSALDVVGVDGRVALVGSVAPGPRVDFAPDAFVRNLSRVVGTHNYTVDDLAEAVRFLARTPVQGLFAALVPPALPPGEIDAAVAAARAGTAPRVALHVDRE
ncbi:hypothetical protein ACWENA_10045 [Streptomyces sp. NPDC004779]